jgi:hypothetical protein
MKIPFTFKNVMPQSFRLGAAVASLLLLATAASSASPEVLLPSSLPYGYSYEEWSAKYWQWTLGQSTNHYAKLGTADICSGPASRVRFPGPSIIGGDAVHVVTNHITIAAGTPLFFPVLCFWLDNGNCPLSDFGTNTAAQLAALDEAQWSATTETTCTIDGVAVEGGEGQRNYGGVWRHLHSGRLHDLSGRGGRRLCDAGPTEARQTHHSYRRDSRSNQFALR